jgi:hypothetical protein
VKSPKKLDAPVELLPAKDEEGRPCFDVKLADGTTMTDYEYAENLGMTVVQFRENVRQKVSNQGW